MPSLNEEVNSKQISGKNCSHFTPSYLKSTLNPATVFGYRGGCHNFIESNHASVEVSKPQPVSLRKHRTTTSSGSCQNYQKANFLAWLWHNHNNTTYYISVGLIANIFYGFKLPRWQRDRSYIYMMWCLMFCTLCFFAFL